MNPVSAIPSSQPRYQNVNKNAISTFFVQDQYMQIVNSIICKHSIKDDLLSLDTYNTHQLYIKLFRFLSPLFPAISGQIVDELSLSGYLYFRSLLIADGLEDKITNNFNLELLDEQYNVVEILASESLLLMSKHFPEYTPFWQEFQELKQEYERTTSVEKQLSVDRPLFSENLFKNIATGKSVMSHAAVAAFCHLTGDFAYHCDLKQCLNHLHIAIQYMDDVEDFDEDIINGQYTYPQYLIGTYLNERQLHTNNSRELLKYLHLSGITNNLIGQSLIHLEESKAIAFRLKLDDLAIFIERKIEKYKLHKQEITFLIKKAEIKIGKSVVFSQNYSLGESLDRASNYLSANADEEGVWTDFLTSAGFGESWITAYVGLQLAESGRHKSLLNKSIDWLMNPKLSERPISYNHSVIQDGDTTTFSIGFQNAMGWPVSSCQYADWFRFMNNDGGWVTYRDEQNLRRRLMLEEEGVAGWLSAKNCVSAAAAYVLSCRQDSHDHFELTCQYLTGKINENGSVDSYWWTGPTYATAYTVMALSRSRQHRHKTQSSVDWLLSCQHPGGYWLNEYVKTHSPLFTALCIKALILFDAKRYQKQIKQGIDWLLAVQTSDGSWQTNRVLQIPATDIDDPSTVFSWRNSSFGVNCIVDDHNRVFTTATVLNALELFGGLAKILPPERNEV
ncbi:prenyltransferase/squalene oxidase repeat-containing protein [Spirosoma montaniterrae]|uniref:Squalene cyclase C-terminal domain-containing protein n=1 Tax=Spirosoma montaniterrae TaxID=1178516 RepID=A0A1P9WUC4_9BACT|nr:prenyltransferase/squalene oxidase repeat-containing protein [Spirosoma montaniterrae]AQG78943.1 hypothetical protein AWR27_06145 [Spirosoma montaniterrae]